MSDEILEVPLSMPTHVQQCLFYVYAEPAVHAGILYPGGLVCSLKDGRIFYPAEEGTAWRLIKTLSWTDLDDCVCNKVIEESEPTPWPG